MKELKFDRLSSDTKITTLVEITNFVIQKLEEDGITQETSPEGFFLILKDTKIAEAIRDWRFTEDGKIILSSTVKTKGVLDYGKEQGF
jgi:hypothetical protein